MLVWPRPTRHNLFVGPFHDVHSPFQVMKTTRTLYNLGKSRSWLNDVTQMTFIKLE